MRNLVEHIVNKEYDTANQIFESEIDTVLRIKLNEAKKMCAAKMSEQVPAFMGAAAGNAVKLRRGVLEEDDLDEMDLSSFPPDYANIEDRRGQTPNVKAGDWWARNHWKKMGQKVTQQQADDIKSGKMAGGSPFPKSWEKKNNTTVIAKTPDKPTNTTTIVKSSMQEETEELDEARIKILKTRVRGGKVQRRKKVSGVEGYKIVDGKLKRMSPAERRRRKLGQKRGKLKRRAKMRQTLMKRKRSLRKRSAIGL